MQEACDQVRSMIRRGENHMKCDVEFHTMLARCTRNSVIYTLIPIINQAIPYFIDITRRELVEQTIETHQQVLDAVRARDGIPPQRPCAAIWSTTGGILKMQLIWSGNGVGNRPDKSGCAGGKYRGSGPVSEIKEFRYGFF